MKKRDWKDGRRKGVPPWLGLIELLIGYDFLEFVKASKIKLARETKINGDRSYCYRQGSSCVIRGGRRVKMQKSATVIRILLCL